MSHFDPRKVILALVLPVLGLSAQSSSKLDPK